jgi:hypothetical protein
MRFALAGGGTGGHAYPAIAVAEQLRAQPGTELVYYGTKGPEHEIADREGIPFRAVPASQVRGRSPVALARASPAVAAARASPRAAGGPPRRRLRDRRLRRRAGRARREAGGIPLVVFLPDAYPGGR